MSKDLEKEIKVTDETVGGREGNSEETEEIEGVQEGIWGSHGWLIVDKNQSLVFYLLYTKAFNIRLLHIKAIQPNRSPLLILVLPSKS